MSKKHLTGSIEFHTIWSNQNQFERFPWIVLTYLTLHVENQSQIHTSPKKSNLSIKYQFRTRQISTKFWKQNQFEKLMESSS